jgi:GTP-binding protein
VVATKLDATTDRERLDTLREYAAKRGLEFHAISSATGEGIVELVRSIANALDRIPKPPTTAELAQRSADLADSETANTLPDADAQDHAIPHREDR